MTATDSDKRQQRWLEIAEYVLGAYDMHDAEVRWLAETHNVVLSVTHDAQQYVLRFETANSPDMALLESEALWLKTLASNGLLVPYPVIMIQVESDEELKIDDIAPVIQGVLFDYLPGKSPTPDTITPEIMGTIGGVMAQMHEIAVRGKPPRTFRRPRLDFSGLFEKSGIYHPGEGANIFSHEQRRIMDETTDVVRAAMDAVGQRQETFGIIHGDLLFKNILLFEDTIRMLDFEYCGFGYYIYDLTPVLWQLKTHPQYRELRDALWDAYCAVRPVMRKARPHLEAFIAARQVASMRWLAGNLHNPAVAASAEQLIATRSDELAGYLKTGELKRTSPTL